MVNCSRDYLYSNLGTTPDLSFSDVNELLIINRSHTLVTPTGRSGNNQD